MTDRVHERIPYNFESGSSSLTSVPPFDFDHVILRVFPLRAGMYGLRQFCDRYLNMDQPFYRFEPSLPFVFLSVISYGKMGHQASNLGWVSQNEVAFGVPLTWKERPHDWAGEGDDRWVARDSATACPFIFVDEEASVMTGREVYGWAKSLAWLTPDVNAWTKDPRSDQTLFRLGAKIFPELFAGRKQEVRTLLEIEHAPPPTIVEVPPDPFNPLNPLLTLPKAILESTRLARDLVQFLAGLPIRGYSPDRRLSDLFRIPWSGTGLLNRLPAANTINLKQFRSSDDPQNACYQALTSAQMRVNCFNSGGLLGDLLQLRGDPSGGYRVKIHRYEAWPIVSSLSLEMAEEHQQRDHSMAVLKPVCPFWVDVDLHYGRGEVLCWQSRHYEWSRPPEPPRPRERPPQFSFNTAEGGSLDQVTGPFTFPDVTHRVLPLLADRSKLEIFCDRYLNHAEDAQPSLPGMRFEPWGKYVYMVATNFGAVASDSANLGWWADRQVAFYIPVKWYREVALKDLYAKSAELGSKTLGKLRTAGLQTVRELQNRAALREAGMDGETIEKVWRWAIGKEAWRLDRVAMVAPYMFADSDVAATTGREVQGWPVVKAALESPPSSWMESAGSTSDSGYLTLRTKVFPALNTNSRLQERVLLEITGRDILPRHRDSDWRSVAHGWLHQVVRRMEADRSAATASERRLSEQFAISDEMKIGTLAHLKALAVELLALGRPINVVALKQFLGAGEPPTSGEPAAACYQALTLNTEQIAWLYDLQEIDELLHVAIHHYPTFPIVDKLGLAVKWTDSTQATRVDYLQPLRPFWLRLSSRSDLGREILSRTGAEWHPAECSNGYFSPRADLGRPRPGAELAQEIDERKRGVKTAAARWAALLEQRNRLGQEGGALGLLAVTEAAESYFELKDLLHAPESDQELALSKQQLLGIMEEDHPSLRDLLSDIVRWLVENLEECTEERAAQLRRLSIAAATAGAKTLSPSTPAEFELTGRWLDRKFGGQPDLEPLVKSVHEVLGRFRNLVESLQGLEDQLHEKPSRMSREDAIAAVEMLEPQMAIQSMLANHWGRADRATLPPAPHGHGDFLLRRDSIGHEETAENFARAHGLEEVSPSLWRLRGAPGGQTAPPAPPKPPTESAPDPRRRAFQSAREQPLEPPAGVRWNRNYRLFVSFLAHLQNETGPEPIRFDQEEVAEWLGVKPATTAEYRRRAEREGLLASAGTTPGLYRFALEGFPALDDDAD